MNTKSILTIAITALLPVAGFAQAAPAPPAPPVPPAPGQPALPGMHNHDKGPKVPVTFLGVETSPVPSVVSEQLGLAKGFGLVVDYVVPESPAAAAGLQQNDILKMLNDQILMEPGQLRKLLQTFTEGTNVTLTVLRKGQEQKITVKLVKKEVPKRHSLFDGKHDWNWNWNFDDMDLGDLSEKMQGLKEQLKEQLGDAGEVVREAVNNAREEAKQAREQAREESRRARDEARAARDAAREVRIQSKDNGALKATRIDLGKAQIVFSDDKGEMKLETLNGKKLLTAKDPQGKLLFSGPVETNEEIDKLPAEVRERFDKLKNSDLPSVAPLADEDEESANDDEEDEDDSSEPSINQVSTHSRVGNMSVLITL